MKKKLALIITFIISLSVIILSVFIKHPKAPEAPNKENPQAQDYTEGLAYKLSEDGTAYICIGIGTASTTEISIPKEHSGKPVTGIAPMSFAECNRITEVIIPETVTSIGEGAFFACASLKSIALPFPENGNGTEEAQPLGYLFGTENYLGAVSVIQYTKKPTAAYGTFETYYIPKGLKSVTVTGNRIPPFAFYNCAGLTDITVGEHITEIGERAFGYCTGLKSITFESTIGWHASGAPLDVTSPAENAQKLTSTHSIIPLEKE